MKPLLIIGLLLIFQTTLAQQMQQPQLGITLDSIGKIVDTLKANAPSLMRTITRQYIEKGKPVDYKLNYSRSNGQLIYLQMTWTIDSTYYEEDYYVSNGKLLYSEEKKIYYMPRSNGKEETAHWMEYCYFINDRLIHERSQGHGKSELDTYDPETEVLKRYKIRRLILKQLLQGPDVLYRPRKQKPAN